MPNSYLDKDLARDVPPFAGSPDIACRTEPPEIFFPRQGQNANRARRTCGRCPHRAECLRWAVSTGQEFGVWGGLTPEERWPLRQLRRVSA